MRSYCDSLRLFIDFLISSKMMKNILIEDLRAMQAQSKAWAKSLNKHSPTREYEKIYDLFLVPWQLGALSKMNIVMLEIFCSGIYLLIMFHDRDHCVILLWTSLLMRRKKVSLALKATKALSRWFEYWYTRLLQVTKQQNKYSTKAFMIGLNFLLRICEIDISVSQKAMETTYLLLTKEELWFPSRFLGV